MSAAVLFFVCVILQALCNGFLAANIPEYIHLCKRDQDTISDCVKNSIEALKPKLEKGIPELNVPGIEPLLIKELELDFGNVFKAVGRHVKIRGVSDFDIKKFEVDLDRLEIKTRILIPNLIQDGSFDVDAKLVMIPTIHGTGHIHSNATGCLSDIVMKCKLEERKGEKYLKLDNIDMKIDVHDYDIYISDMFRGNPELGKVVSSIVRDNKADFLKASMPYLERTTAFYLKKIANKILSKFTYDEVLPLP